MQEFVLNFHHRVLTLAYFGPKSNRCSRYYRESNINAPLVATERESLQYARRVINIPIASILAISLSILLGLTRSILLFLSESKYMSCRFLQVPAVPAKYIRVVSRFGLRNSDIRTVKARYLEDDGTRQLTLR